VLLVDGSTFTVGPGSDLVIDKLVYDPNKKTGQVVASLSKGVMRFVGGKISKNDEGVTIKTPAGALAIRGGMGMAQVNGPKSAIFAFLYGVEMKLTQPNGVVKVVFEPGNGIFINNGTTEIKKFSATDINALMAALNKNSGNSGPAPGTTPPPNNGVTKAADINNADQIVNEATAQQIQDTIAKEIAKLTDTPTETPGETPGETPTTPITDDTPPPPPPPPADTLALGYAAGATRTPAEVRTTPRGEFC
jgi:hypothetical protein